VSFQSDSVVEEEVEEEVSVFLTADQKTQLEALMVGCVSTKDFIREVASVLRDLHSLNHARIAVIEQARCLETAICLMPEDSITEGESDHERARRIAV
jgi:hypothetical protein